MSRHPFLVLAGFTLLALGGLLFLAYRETATPAEKPKPLVVYCAAALKPAMQAVAEEYERESGTPLELRFGNSEQVLAQASIGGEGDLLLPADDSYVRVAQQSGVATEAFALARMRAVALVRTGNPLRIAAFADLLHKDVKLGQANPDAAAIGRVTRDHLKQSGRWQALNEHTTAHGAYLATVTDAANAVELESCDAAIVWDAVAANYPKLVAVKMPELDGAIGRVEIALLRSSHDPEAAKRLVQFLRSERGRAIFQSAGFTDLIAP